MPNGDSSLPRISRRVLLRRGGRTLSVLALLPLAACDDGDDAPPTARDAGGARRDAGQAARDGGMDAMVARDAGSGAGAIDGAEDAGAPEGDGALPALDGGALTCAELLTPLDAFYKVFGANGLIADWQQPALAADSWRLTIEGLVAEPFELSLAQLEADRDHHVTVLATLQCVFVSWGTAIWTGVPVRALLDRARVDRDKLRRVRFHGADGFVNNVRVEDLYPAEPIADAFEPLVAFRMAGERLRPEHGFPARLLLCDRYGYKNIKWLSAIEATDDDAPAGQYQELGFSDDATVGFTVFTPANLRMVSAGPLEVCGHARSGQGGIVAVEAAIDGGEFAPVTLASLEALRAAEPALEQVVQVQQPSRYPWPFRGVWVPWQLSWQATPGDHVIALRAIDRSGKVSQQSELHFTVA